MRPRAAGLSIMRMHVLVFVAIGGLGMTIVGAARGRPAPAPAEKVRMIPLESCYATEGVSGCPHLKRVGEPYAFDLNELIRDNRTGASNVALVRGKDIAAAVKAARWTFAAGMRADAPVPPNPSDTKAEPLPLWLVAYFGMGPSNPGFGRVQPAEVRGQTVRVAYARARSAGGVTTDEVPYYLWVPLGDAQAGTYTLELFDADRKDVTLLRRVAVAER
jgi:hypothetical protein